MYVLNLKIHQHDVPVRRGLVTAADRMVLKRVIVSTAEILVF
jgi:hypothetical protein